MDKGTVGSAVEQGVRAELDGLIENLAFLTLRLVRGESSSRDFELDFRGTIMNWAADAIGRTLSRLDPAVREAVRRQGHRAPDGSVCHGSIPSKGKKEVTITTLLGSMKVCRGTFQCNACGKSGGMLDELLQVTPEHMTPACASVCAEAASMVSFQRAEKTVLDTAGVDVDAKRIHRTVQRVAPSAGRLLEKGPEALAPEVEAIPPPYTPLCASIDGGRIRMRGGAWREPYIGMVWWQGTDGKLRRFPFAQIADKEKVFETLDRWLEAFRRKRSGKPLILADGARWIWDWAAQHKDAVLVLDYYHLKQKIWEAAEVLYGEGSPRVPRWVQKVMGRIWRGWVFSTILKLDYARPTGGNRWRKQQALRALATYLDNHRDFMPYRRLRHRGRPIGSGLIESACKQVFSMRLKGPGMFWSEPGAQNLMNLRALLVADRWDELWNDIHKHGYAHVTRSAA